MRRIDPAKLPRADRFRYDAHLGSGAFGDVYLAHDRTRGHDVAVKVLRDVGPSQRELLQREFRSLAEVAHPGLVTLHELLADGDRWCIAMEYVDGVDLLTRFRAAGDDGEAQGSAAARGRPASVDFDAVRSVFLQIAEALAEVHAAGKLHLDVKPPNVRVTRDDRAVLLDFGLVSDPGPRAPRPDGIGRGLGSAGYMSPEQVLGLALDASSDWYSFGATLYDVLTGRLPFDGPPLEVAFKKNFVDAPDPAALAPHAPRDLLVLCRRLVARAPADRPDGDEILARLGHPASAARVSDVPRPPVVALDGRDDELARLRASFVDGRDGATVLVTVSGASGIGKSALVQQHLAALEAGGATAVLRGRCHERESVPYQALDGVVDELVRNLVDDGHDAASAGIAPWGAVLSRLFPVFRRLRGCDEGAAARGPVSLWELRRDAARGLAQAFAALRGARSVVVAIDDVQWADGDSAEMLGEILRADVRGANAWVLVDRDDAGVPHAPLRAVLDRAQHLRRLRVELRPLSMEVACQVAARALERATDDDVVRHVARESAGNPFFLHELCRAATEASERREGPSLDELVRRRVARLPEPARRLVEVVALSGSGLPVGVAFHAAGPDRALVALASLRSVNLVRSTGADGLHLVAWHDRVREGVVAGLDEGSARALHADLATAWEAHGSAEPEVLLGHHRAAGDTVRAGRYAVLAARRAADALAFDHAAKLYALALALLQPSGEERRGLQSALAAALGDAGRGKEAADAWLAAADGASRDEAVERRRRAAEHLLRAGYMDEGLAVGADVLAAFGMTLPRTPLQALVVLGVHRARIRLRGLGFVERAQEDCPAWAVARLDAFWSVAAAISIIDVVRSASLQSQALLLALDLGEPSRISRALSIEAGFTATAGGSGRRRAADLLARARDLAERVESPDALGLAEVMTGVAAWCDGRWSDAAAAGARAAAILDTQCTGVAWERSTSTIFRLDALYYLGDWAALLDEVPQMLAGAIERADRYTETLAAVRFECVAGFTLDDPERVERGLARARSWSDAGVHSIHLVELHETAELAMYRGQWAAARAVIAARWSALDRSLLLEVQAFRIQMRYLRARAALGVASQSGPGVTRWRLLREVESDARRIDAEDAGWGAGIASLLRGGAAAVASRRDASIELFGAAAAHFDASRMRAHAAVARRQRASLTGDAAGVDAAEATLRSCGVRNFARIAAMLAPGVEVTGR